MAGDSVHFARVHHHRVGSRFRGCRKRRKKIFSQSILRNERGAAVAAGGGIAVAHIVLQRSRNTEGARKITALITTDRSHTHDRRKISVFTQGLPQARPQRLPSSVEHGRKSPWNSGFARFG